MPGNVFEQLGFGNEKAEDLRIRADLMDDIADAIHARGWTQEEAAEHLGIARPRISEILNGHIDKMSIDYLVKLAPKLGCRVDMHLEPGTKPAEPA